MAKTLVSPHCIKRKRLARRRCTSSVWEPGQYYDQESGLIHNGHRTLDAKSGRYLETDLIGQAGGMSTYGYANQNPLSYIDPLGLVGVDVRSVGPIGEMTEYVRYDVGPQLYMLPQNFAEYSFYNYGTPRNGAGQYVTAKALSTIFEVENGWTLSGETKSFGIGNISLEGGGKFSPHRSHKVGLDIDIRPMNLDGAQCGGITWRSSRYDRVTTQRLVDAFLATGQVKVIYFNDPKLRGVSPMGGHDNHLHIAVKP